MNIAMISTKNDPPDLICGVASYSEILIDAFKRLGYDIFHVNQKDGHFSTGYQNQQPIFNAQSIINKDVDVIHIQYQDFLYPDKDGLLSFLSWCHNNQVKVVYTLHDFCVPSIILSQTERSQVIVHHQSFLRMCPKAFVIPQPVPILDVDLGSLSMIVDQIDGLSTEFFKKKVISFGLGRNQYELLIPKMAEICKDRKDVIYLICVPLKRDVERIKSFIKEEDQSYVFVVDQFLKKEILYSLLMQCDACLIDYPDIQEVVTSSSLRWAIGAKCTPLCRRSKWFDDVVDEQFVVFYHQLEDLKERIHFILDDHSAYCLRRALMDDYIGKYRSELVVEKHLEVYLS